MGAMIDELDSADVLHSNEALFAKIDLNGFANTRWAALPITQHPTAQMIYGLLAPPEYDPLFEDRLKMDRWELIGNIRDWVDIDDQRSGIWGGDENSIYHNEEPRYRAKNAPFDSVGELRMVAGVSDECSVETSH